MNEIVTKTSNIEKQAVYSKDMKYRYELTITLQGKKGKNILVLCLNPASHNILVSDTTTNYLMNNLFSMGYTTITVCNLFSTICGKLTASGISDNSDGNSEYLKSVLERDFQTILIGYGNTFSSNKRVTERKEEFNQFLLDSGKKAVELVDKQDVYSRLHTIHPLFAGQRFSGEWKFRKYMIEKKTNKEDKTNVHQNQQKEPVNNTKEHESVSEEKI